MISEQPQAINNRFVLVPNEKIRRVFTHQPGCCGCGPTFTVTLTDTRIIQRHQEYACCGTGNQYDTMVFLSDIGAMGDAVGGRSKCPSCDLCSILCCFCACFCGACCKSTASKPIAVRGTFGEEVFTFDIKDVPSALADIPAVATPHKTPHYRQ